jgi:hypothetical protein
VRNSRYRFTRLIMSVTGVLYFVNGVVLVSRPDVFLGYLNVAADGVHQVTTARYAADPAFRRAAVLSVLGQGALSGLAYTAPGTPTNWRYALIGVSAAVGLLYLVTLPITPVGYTSD